MKSTGRRVRTQALRNVVRAQFQHQLGDLADTISIDLKMDEVVLSDAVRHGVNEILNFGKHADTVYEQWGLGRLTHAGQGIAALFSGPPGTGKTLVAAIVARELGRLLYRIDLSRVVDKYIGETEKNLNLLFDHAERAQAVLLFDEADSLFASRTQVKSSNDRYANLEVNFLLQKLENYSGISILTTNLAHSLDEAFQRRIRVQVEFAVPDVEARKELWRGMETRSSAPFEEDMPWDKLATLFELSPAAIYNVVTRAGFLACEANSLITFELIHAAAVQEMRKSGSLVQV